MIKIASASGAAPKYQLDIADTIIDFNDRPHRMIKMRITGMTFPHKDAPVFVRIRNAQQTDECWMTEIAEKDMALYGFLPVDTELRGDVEFGYGNTVIGVFKKIKWELIRRLDDAKVEKAVTAVDKEWLKKMRASRKKGM